MQLRKNIPLIILVLVTIIVIIILGIGVYYNLKDYDFGENVSRVICIALFLVVVFIISEFLLKRQPLRQYENLKKAREAEEEEKEKIKNTKEND